MALDFSKVKAKVRQVVHSTLAVQATYQDSTMEAPVPIKARWLNKLNKIGDLENSGYAEVLEDFDRVVLDVESARLVGVKKGGVITFTAYQNTDGKSPTFTLAVKYPTTGLVEEIWEVTRA